MHVFWMFNDNISNIPCSNNYSIYIGIIRLLISYESHNIPQKILKNLYRRAKFNFSVAHFSFIKKCTSVGPITGVSGITLSHGSFSEETSCLHVQISIQFFKTVLKVANITTGILFPIFTPESYVNELLFDIHISTL